MIYSIVAVYIYLFIQYIYQNDVQNIAEMANMAEMEIASKSP